MYWSLIFKLWLYKIKFEKKEGVRWSNSRDCIKFSSYLEVMFMSTHKILLLDFILFVKW